MSLTELLFGFTPATRAAHPHLFATTAIDRRGCKRVVPMEVLSLGMGRTGTASMREALVILGYPTSHGADMHSNPLDGEIWQEAVNAAYYGDTSVTLDTAFFDQVLGHVSACTDYPPNLFPLPLIAAYPRAKIILVERPPLTWLPSFTHSLIRGQDSPPWYRHLLALLSTQIAQVQPLLWRGMMQGQFGSRNATEWRKNAVAVYERHNRQIREALKDEPERLLVYKMGSGWGPLCEFLGKEVPDVEFPRVNEQGEHDAMLRVFVMQIVRSFLGRVLKVGAAGGVAWVAWWWWRKTAGAAGRGVGN